MMRKGVKISLPVLIIIFLTMLFSFEVKSQDNYKPGYIISNDGDTTRGHINYLGWAKTPQVIEFAQNLGGSDEVIASYKPEEIKSFQVQNEFFESRVLEIDLTPHKIILSNINADIEASQENVVSRKVFIQRLIDSEVLSLFLHEEERQNFYIKHYQTGLIRLISNEYVVRGYEDKLYVNKENKYKFRDQITNTISNCSNIRNIDKLSYSIASLMEFILDCNSYLGVENLYYFEREKPKISHGVVIGLNKSDAVFGPREFNGEQGAIFGYSMHIVLPRNRNTRSITIEAMYSKLNSIEDSQNQRNKRLEVDALKFRFLYGRRLSPSEAAPIFLYGISTTRVLDDITTTEGEESLFNKKQMLNLAIGVSLNIEKSSILVIYEPIKKENSFSSFRSLSVNLRLGLP